MGHRAGAGASWEPRDHLLSTCVFLFLYGRTDCCGCSELGQLLDHWVYTFVRCRNMVAKMVPSYQERYLGKVNLRVTLSYKTSDADTVEADPISPSEQRGVESLGK